MTRLVMVDVPNDSKKRSGLPSGTEKPDSICRGNTLGVSVDSFATSIVGSLDTKKCFTLKKKIDLIFFVKV
jgi:hypothetical protein